jgi:hypothetical protein
MSTGWACLDCGDNTIDEYFVIDHDLWAAAVGDPQAGKICVPCLEARLGRLLVPDDFIDCPANDPTWRKTDRLRQRLGPDRGLRTTTKTQTGENP